MDWKIFATIFGTVFLAELGDKTQLATMVFASDKSVSKLTVFAASAAALVTASALGVMAGKLLGDWINPQILTRIAGVAFVVIGVWTFVKA